MAPIELPELPASVLNILTAARDAIGQEAREATRAVTVPRIVRGAQVAVRINGENYAPAAASIVEAVTGDRLTVTRPVELPAGDPLDAETQRQLGQTSVRIPESWTTLGDSGECDCDESDCEACNPPCESTASGCCGYCRDCERHHEDDEDYRRLTCSHCDRCFDCDHDCSN